MRCACTTGIVGDHERNADSPAGTPIRRQSWPPLQIHEATGERRGRIVGVALELAREREQVGVERARPRSAAASPARTAAARGSETARERDLRAHLGTQSRRRYRSRSKARTRGSGDPGATARSVVDQREHRRPRRPPVRAAARVPQPCSRSPDPRFAEEAGTVDQPPTAHPIPPPRSRRFAATQWIDPPVVVGNRRLGILQPPAGEHARDDFAPSAPYFSSPATDAAEAGSQKIPSREASRRYAARICRR